MVAKIRKRLQAKVCCVSLYPCSMLHALDSRVRVEAERLYKSFEYVGHLLFKVLVDAIRVSVEVEANTDF